MRYKNFFSITLILLLFIVIIPDSSTKNYHETIISISNSTEYFGRYINRSDFSFVPKEFFMDLKTGDLRVFIVISKEPSLLDLESAEMIAMKISEITSTNVRIEHANLVDYEYWKTDCNQNLILLGDPTNNIIIRQLVEEGYSQIIWMNSLGEGEYMLALYGCCDILIIGGKDEYARRRASLSLIDYLENEFKGILVRSDPCNEISCPDTECYGYDLWSVKCKDGDCIKDYILEKNCEECGYRIPTLPPSLEPSSSPSSSNFLIRDLLFIIFGIILGSIIIGGYISKKQFSARRKEKPMISKKNQKKLKKHLDEDYIEDRISREEYLKRKKELEGE